jgi:hypothetical protein
VSVTLATLISKKLDARWKHSYDRDIEQFKGRLEQDRMIINTALPSLNAVSAAFHEHILKAVETLWDAMLKLGNAFPGVTLYADILTQEEWCNLPGDARTKDKMVIPSDKDVMRFMTDELAAAEHARPFVGEVVWSMYFVYRAFILRVVGIAQRNFDAGRLPPWYKDKGIQQFVRLLLTEEEIRAAEQSQGGLFRHVRQLAESKILAEMNRIIAGHRSADSGLEHARKMLQTVAGIERGTKT